MHAGRGRGKGKKETGKGKGSRSGKGRGRGERGEGQEEGEGKGGSEGASERAVAFLFLAEAPDALQTACGSDSNSNQRAKGPLRQELVPELQHFLCCEGRHAQSFDQLRSVAKRQQVSTIHCVCMQCDAEPCCITFVEEFLYFVHSP